MTRNCLNVMRKVAAGEERVVNSYLANSPARINRPTLGGLARGFTSLTKGPGRLHLTPQASSALRAGANRVAPSAVANSGLWLGSQIGKKLIEQPNLGQKLYMPAPTDAELRKSMTGVDFRRAVHGLPDLTNSKYSQHYNPGFTQRLKNLFGW